MASLVSGTLYSPTLQAAQPPVPPTAKVGLQNDGSVVLPDSQVIRPAGRQITFIGCPSVIAIRPDNKTAVVMNGDGNTGFAAGPIVIIDLVKGTVIQQLRPTITPADFLSGSRPRPLSSLTMTWRSDASSMRSVTVRIGRIA
jgi:hypothetical protein